jgi:phosphatidylglycerol:prolipoprotein diacylglycerol transferase
MVNPVAWHFVLFGLDINIRWYGVIIAVGLLLAIILAMYHAKREGHDPDSMLDLALIIIPLAVICARIYYVVLNWNVDYANRPFWHVFAIWEGGLAIYGGVIGGFLGVWIYSRFVNRKAKFVDLLDLAAPSLILGQAIGRWGNFVNQEAYGYAVTNPAWQWFPAAVKIQNPVVFNGVINTPQPEGWFMATFFYESMWNLLVFAFLFFYFRNYKKRRPGDVFWFYLLLYGIGRAVIEGLRTDSLYIHGTSIRASQLLSILLIAVALCGLFRKQLAPVFMPLLRKIGAAFAKLFAAIKQGLDFKARREEAEKRPLDESLKLTVELRDEPDDDNGETVEKEKKKEG